MRNFIFSLVAVLLIFALFFVNRYVPFQIEAALVYLGICVLILGLLSVIKPIKYFHINTRKSACIISGAGFLIFLTGMIFPSPIISSKNSHKHIDDFIPEYQFYEYHEVIVGASVDKISKVMREVSLKDLPVAKWLMRARSVASDQLEKPVKKPVGADGKRVDDLLSKPIPELLLQPGSGFLMLDDSDPDEYVIGMVGKPWTIELPPNITTPDEFVAFRLPGNIKVAFNMHVVDMGNGSCRLSSETRILCVDASARKIFGRYWRVIYPGSSIIRRLWLDKIADFATSM